MKNLGGRAPCASPFDSRREALLKAQRALLVACDTNAALDIPFIVRQTVAEAYELAQQRLDRASRALDHQNGEAVVPRRSPYLRRQP